MARSGPVGALATVALAAALLFAPAVAQGFKVKTNRGGKCTVKPETTVAGDRVTYGVAVRNCQTRNGVKWVASEGFAIEGHEIVATLGKKTGPPPYLNRTTSDRVLPDLIGDLPIDLPDLPIEPPLPELPIEIPPLPKLPIPGIPGGSNPGATYTRLDYSLRLARDKGRRAKRKPERWRPREGCRVTTTKRSSDTIACQSFAPTG